MSTRKGNAAPLELTIDAQAFALALNQAARGCSSRNSAEVLRAVRLDASGETLTLTEGCTRIPDSELAELCDENGFPSVADRLASGETQEEATAYMLGVPIGEPDDDCGPYFYDDAAGRWLAAYIAWLHRGDAQK